jgi:N-acetylglucosaminyldiphosphoundecaprenol N-acetyl-beta-D-mannosaminyltransferase
MASLKILDIRVDKVDMMGALCVVDSFVQEGGFHHIVTLNAEIIYQAQFNQPLKDLINSADLVTPDGAGIVWAAGFLGEPVPERVTGIDLMLEICKQARHNGWRIYLLGGSPGVADEAADKLRAQYPNINIVGTHHGYFKENEEAEVLEKVRKAEPDLIFVALGAPRQEFWIRAHKESLPVKVAIGVGGSFDVVSGRVKRAPVWMQKLKLEWLARLIKEPWRLKRMLSLPKFVLMVIRSKSELEAKKKLEKKKRLP